MSERSSSPVPRIEGSVDNCLEILKLVVDGIASILGDNCEVVLHDIRQPEHSIVAIANGHVSGRSVGGPIIGGPVGDKGLKSILEQAEGRGVVANYATRTRDGRTLKSTSVVLEDHSGVPVIGLCLNLDITELQRAADILAGLVTVDWHAEDASTGQPENGKTDVNSMIKCIVDEAVAAMHRPPSAASKEDKLKAIRAMHAQGLFLVKGGVDHAARALGVSRFTVYNYLKELQFREPPWESPAP